MTQSRPADDSGIHGILEAASRRLEAGSGGTVVLDAARHPEAQAVIANFTEAASRMGRAVFHARARPAQCPFSLVAQAFEGGQSQRPDPPAVVPWPLVTERTGDSLLPREVVSRFLVMRDALSFLARHAADAPVLVVFEDLQSADSASVTFATHLATYAATVPMLFVVTHRRGAFPQLPGDFLDSVSRARAAGIAIETA